MKNDNTLVPLQDKRFRHCYKTFITDNNNQLHTCKLIAKEYKESILIVIQKEKSIKGFNEEEFAENIVKTISAIKRIDRFKEGLFDAYFHWINVGFVFDWIGKAFIRVRKNDGKIIGYKVFIKNKTIDFSNEIYTLIK